MQINWHALGMTEVLKKARSSRKGLTENEAQKRLKRNGRNEIPQKKPLSRWWLFFHQLKNPLVYILLAIIVISFFLGHYVDTVFILLVLLINTVVSFYQEVKADEALKELKNMVSISVRVKRKEGEMEIDSTELVVGDIMVLKEGDKVAADCRLIKAWSLETDEASLTGESSSVKKDKKIVAREASITEQTNMIFAGTSVVGGEGEAVATATSEDTEFGKMAGLLREVRETATPLQKKIARFSKFIGIFILLLTVVIIILGYFSGQNLEQILMAALALAVSSIPEGLLPAITVVLVLAMRRILKNKGVVKKLSATEGLGGVTVICADKTGTLTEGKMRATHIFCNREEILDQEIDLKVFSDKKSEKGSNSELILKIATLTNDAFIENPNEEKEKWIVRGRYTDKALLMTGLNAGLKVIEVEKEYETIKKWNFDSDQRFAASLHETESKRVLFVAGSPEEILNRSGKYLTENGEALLTKASSSRFVRRLEKEARSGSRVVACAFKNVSEKKVGRKEIGSLAKELTFVGFISLRDPIREDAKGAIEKIKSAGIRPVIITGDHRLTAEAVASEVGIEVNRGSIIEGVQLEKMSQTELQRVVKKISLYARTLPKQKLRIVKALQNENENVAMIGDGVNDAPALKAADIGVALGSGTDVAKEVADIILLDDSYQTIVEAIRQGRVAFDNIRKVIIYLIADDFAEIFLFLGAMAFGLPLPLLAVQILWINLIEDGFPDLALTTEKGSKGVMKRKPQGPDDPIMSRPIKKWMLAVFAINGIVTFVFYFFLWKTTGDIEKTRTMILALMAFDSLIFAYCVRSLRRSVFRKDIFSNIYLNVAVAISFILLILAVYLPLFQLFLKTVPLGVLEWSWIVALTIFELIVFDLFKRMFMSRKRA